METEEHKIKTISLFHSYQGPWNRGQYLEYFSKKLGKKIPYVAWKLQGMQDLRTLAFIKSVADKLVLEGKKGSYAHAFNSALYVPVDKVLQQNTAHV